jgi:hypothetical protein
MKRETSWREKEIEMRRGTLVGKCLIGLWMLLCLGFTIPASADVVPGDVITKDNWEKVQGLVPDPVLNWIKKGDYERAIAFVDFEGMAEIVMAGYWDKMSQKDKNEIMTFMKDLIKEKFPIITHRLKLLKFGAITENGNQVLCDTLAVIDQTTQNKDQKIQIGLVKRGNEWKGVEVYILKEGFLFWYANSAVPLKSVKHSFFERLLNRRIFRIWNYDCNLAS